MEIKHILASVNDKKATIRDTEFKGLIDASIQKIIVWYGYWNDDQLEMLFKGITYHKSRNGKTWYGERSLPKFVLMPKVGNPVFHKIDRVTILF
jgi:hypothetical protein